MKSLNKIYNIVLIGAGNIGSRHLQSIIKLNLPIKVVVIDNNANSLERAKKILRNFENKAIIKSIEFLKKIEEIAITIDLAIIATNADIRKIIIEKLYKQNKIKNLILEKVCFQSVKDFYNVINLVKLNKTKTWVNLAKRTLPIYKNIKKKINKEKKIFIDISSGSFDMGCNTIHVLDILSYLSNSIIKKVDMSLVEKKILKSKRKGFIDFTGTLKAYTFRGDELTLTNYYNNKKPEITEIFTNDYYFLIDTDSKIIKNYKKINQKNQFVSEEIINDSYQSEMTHIVAMDILLNGKSELPSLNESFKLHKPMLEAFINHTTKITKKNIYRCNIT